MKIATKRILSFLFSIVLLVVLVVIYGSFIKPEYEQLTNLRGKLKSKEQAVADYEDDLSHIDALTKSYASSDLNDFKAAVAAIVPAGENAAAAVAQLGSLAKANELTLQALSVQITGIQPSPQAGLVKNLGTVRLFSRLAGTYSNFRNFIHGIETNMAVMDVESVRIETPPAVHAGPPGNLNYTASILTHYEAE